MFHDGGLILGFPDRYLGLFLGFQTQRIPTDAAGNAAAGAIPISQILAGGPPSPPSVQSAVYIERALLDPSGADAGHEIVLVELDGNGVQLGNQGGTVMLQDDHGAQVDVVTYTAADADPEDCFVRFRH